MLRSAAAALTSALLLVALAGCSGTAAATSSTPSTLSVHGSITVTGGNFTDEDSSSDGTATVGDVCDASGGFDDIASGAEVDVENASSKVLGIGRLEDGEVTADTTGCLFQFVVDDVPTGGGIYGVKVGNQARGVVHFTAKKLAAGPSLTLGD